MTMTGNQQCVRAVTFDDGDVIPLQLQINPQAKHGGDVDFEEFRSPPKRNDGHGDDFAALLG